jgi:hypothetical protein
LDSTTITLCLKLFDWAKYRTSKGAIKLHTLLDYDGNLPSYVYVSDGKVGDNKGVLLNLLMLKFLKTVAKYSWHLSNLVSFLRRNLFVKISLQRWSDEPFEKDVGKPQTNQLSFFRGIVSQIGKKSVLNVDLSRAVFKII